MPLEETVKGTNSGDEPNKSHNGLVNLGPGAEDSKSQSPDLAGQSEQSEQPSSDTTATPQHQTHISLHPSKGKNGPELGQISDDQKSLLRQEDELLQIPGQRKSPIQLPQLPPGPSGPASSTMLNRQASGSMNSSAAANYSNPNSLFPSPHGHMLSQQEIQSQPIGLSQSHPQAHAPNGSSNNGVSNSSHGMSALSNPSSLHSPNPKAMLSSIMPSFVSPQPKAQMGGQNHYQYRPHLQPQPQPQLQPQPLPQQQTQPQHPTKINQMAPSQYSTFQSYAPYGQNQSPSQSSTPPAPGTVPTSMPAAMGTSAPLPAPAILPQYTNGNYDIHSSIPDPQFQQSIKTFQVNRMPPNSNPKSRLGNPNKIKKADYRVKSVQERPYKCDHPNCEWAFTRASDLKRHLKSHNTPMYHCPYWKNDPTCHRNGGSFNRLDVLKRHLRLVHYIQDKQDLLVPNSGPKDDPGWCRSCQRMFQNSKMFIEHCQECSQILPPSKWQHSLPSSYELETHVQHTPMHTQQHNNSIQHRFPNGEVKVDNSEMHTIPQSPPNSYPMSATRNHVQHHGHELMNYNIKDNHDVLNDPNNNLLTLSSVINEFEPERKK